MAVRFCNPLQQSPLTLPKSPPTTPLLFARISTTKILAAPSLSSSSFSSSSSPASPSMDLHNQGRQRFVEFPFVSAPHRNLMADLVSTVESRLDSQLLPCTLPRDVQRCQNESGSAHASLHIRSGHPSSPVDFVLGSWLHCRLPTGAALNITSLSAYMKSSTDAPNFLVELIQSSPNTLIIVLDLPPRKDLVLYPDYLQTFYENTKLDSCRQALEKHLPEAQPYFSSSLYLRCVLSPTAIMLNVNTGDSGSGRLEEIINDHVDPVAKEVLGIWLDNCACGEREVGEGEERAYLKKRDQLIKSKTIEIDLGTNFPRLFGPDVANRVVGAIQEYYKV